jgi:chromosome segregation ATPase
VNPSGKNVPPLSYAISYSEQVRKTDELTKSLEKRTNQLDERTKKLTNTSMEFEEAKARVMDLESKVNRQRLVVEGLQEELKDVNKQKVSAEGELATVIATKGKSLV